MRFKVLIPPLLVVMMLILVVWYIKPAFDVLLEKKADVLTKETKLEKAKTTINNVGSLNSSLDTERDFEGMVSRYLPNMLNQEQVIDAFNFLATQSGVVIMKMELKQPIRSQVAPKEEVGGAANTPKAISLAVQTFTFSGSVVGTYENIKEFFDRLAHMERFQKITLFSIAADSNVRPVDINHLVGTFETEFGYLPLNPVVAAADMSVFSSTEFDFTNASKLLEQATSVIPPSETGQAGKPNPFQ